MQMMLGDTTTFLFEGSKGLGDLNSGLPEESELAKAGRENFDLVVGDLYYNLEACEAYRYESDQRWHKLSHRPFLSDNDNCGTTQPLPPKEEPREETEPKEETEPGKSDPLPVPQIREISTHLNALTGDYLTGAHQLPYIIGEAKGESADGQFTLVEKTIANFGTNEETSEGKKFVEDAHVVFAFDLHPELQKALDENPDKVKIQGMSLEFKAFKVSNDPKIVEKTEILCQINYVEKNTQTDFRRCSGTLYNNHANWDALKDYGENQLHNNLFSEAIESGTKEEIEDGLYQFKKDFTGDNKIDLVEYLGTDLNTMVKTLHGAGEPIMFAIADDVTLDESGGLRLNLKWTVEP